MAEDDWVRKAQGDGHDVAQVIQRAAADMQRSADAAELQAKHGRDAPARADEIWVMQERLPDGSWQSRVISPPMMDAIAVSESESFAEIRMRVARIWERANPSTPWEEHRARANRAEFRRA